MTFEPISSLTEREIQVLECAAADLSMSETAQRLGIAAETVKTHRKSVLRKLGKASMTGAVAAWLAALQAQPDKGAKP